MLRCILQRTGINTSEASQPRTDAQVVYSMKSQRGTIGDKSASGWLRGLFKSEPAKSKPAATATKSAPAATPYHAVSINPGEQACAAAYRSSGQRILSRQAPKLPLPTCDAFHCTCRFSHHNDRRAGARRRDDIGLLSGHYPGSERRRTGGRRVTDK